MTFGFVEPGPWRQVGSGCGRLTFNICENGPELFAFALVILYCFNVWLGRSEALDPVGANVFAKLG